MNLGRLHIRGKQAPFHSWEEVQEGRDHRPFCVNLIDRGQTTSFHFERPLVMFKLNGHDMDISVHPPSHPVVIERMADNLWRLSVEMFIEEPIVAMVDRDD